MRTKIKEVLNDCILEGLHSGYQRAYKYEDFPCEENLISHMEDHILFEIDRRFDFERNVCDEVVEGFNHLEKEREWVGLTHNKRIEISHEYRNYDNDIGDWFDRDGFARAIEAELKEKNT